jgi:hypothetical protein
MRKTFLLSLALCLLFLGPADSGSSRNVNGQDKTDSRVCPDIPGQTSATYRFRRLGETIEIPIRGDDVPANLDCEPVALDLRWSNGRNNGSNFAVTFLDANNRPISTKPISAFLNGVVQFPLSSFDVEPVYGSSMGLISVPTKVTIQAVSPFAAPASLSYVVVRMARAAKTAAREEDEIDVEHKREKDGEIVSIHEAIRLIGASRLSLVQIELRTSRPFPVRDVPLRLQIGSKVFLDELSGDYTGRKLTLSLTPAIFAELNNGADVVAFFGEANAKASPDKNIWRFGKLNKAMSGRQ